MKFVPSEHLTGAHRCAITGRSTDPEGFIETNNILSVWDQEVQLSAAAVKEAARILGWVSPEEVEGLKKRVADLGEGLADAEDRLQKITQIKELEAELTA